MSGSQDTGVRLSTEKALMTYTSSEEERHFWPGFAVYCMEVAVSFIKTYRRVMGSPPPGLAADALRTKCQHATERVTVREIQDFVMGTALNQDFRALFDVMEGTLHPELEKSKTEMREREKFIEQLQVDLKRQQEKVTFYEGQIMAQMVKLDNEILKIDQSKRLHTEELKKLNRKIDKIENEKTELSRRFINELEALKSAQADQDIQAQIQKIMNMIYGTDSLQVLSTTIDSIQKDHAENLKVCERLQAENADLKRQIAAGAGAGGGLMLNPEDQAWLDTLVKLVTNIDDTTPEIDRLLNLPLRDTTLTNFGPLQVAMEAVAKYIKTSRPFILAMKRFHNDVQNEDVLKSVEKHGKILATRITGRHWLNKVFSCLTGIATTANLNKLFEELFDQDLNIQMYPYLILRDQPLQIVVGTDEYPSEHPQSIISFLQNVAELRIAKYQKVVLHMFTLLKTIQTQKIVPTPQTYLYLKNAVQSFFSMDVDKLVTDQQLPDICFNVIKHGLVADFPYHLFHSGFYIDLPSDPKLLALRGFITGIDSRQRDPRKQNVVITVQDVVRTVKMASISISAFNVQMIITLHPIPDGDSEDDSEDN